MGPPVARVLATTPRGGAPPASELLKPARGHGVPERTGLAGYQAPRSLCHFRSGIPFALSLSKGSRGASTGPLVLSLSKGQPERRLLLFLESGRAPAGAAIHSQTLSEPKAAATVSGA